MTVRVIVGHIIHAVHTFKVRIIIGRPGLGVSAIR